MLWPSWSEMADTLLNRTVPKFNNLLQIILPSGAMKAGGGIGMKKTWLFRGGKQALPIHIS